MRSYSDFSDISRFFEKLDSALPELPGENSCGDCLECCKYLFYISSYEFDYIKHLLSEKNSALSLKFVVSLPHQSDPRMLQESWLCPLLGKSPGCLAYEARPIACRLMGAYLPFNSVPIQGCVYKSPTVYHHLEDIPLWDEFVKILRKYPSLPGYFIREDPV